MIGMEDERWDGLTGGYRVPIEVRPLLRALETGEDDERAWDALWEELQHQGDVGIASYAAVPHLIRIHRDRGIPDWRIYAIVAIIELARTRAENPEIPNWLKADYFEALHDLAKIGTSEILKTPDADCARCILAILAIDNNLRIHGQLLVSYSGDELSDMKTRGEPAEL